MKWTAALRFDGGMVSTEEMMIDNKRNVTKDEIFIIFKFSLADKAFLIGKDVILDVYGGAHTVSDVAEGRKFSMPSFIQAGSKIFIQENDNGVYQSFSAMNLRKPFKAIYFDRFNSLGQETAYTD